MGSLDGSKEIDTDGITVSSCVGVCDGESVTGDIVGVCDGEFVTVDMVTASHQIRSGIPRNSATDISSTVPPTPKNPLIFLDATLVGVFTNGEATTCIHCKELLLTFLLGQAYYITFRYRRLSS